MIFDTLEYTSRYAPAGSRLEAAFAYLKENDLAALPVGRIEIDGANLYALVQEYTTRPVEQGKWEAHREYIDIQYLVSGSERMGFANLASLQPGKYTAERDYLAASGAANFVDVFAGSFVVFFPEDGHMPCLSVEEPQPVRKVVLKVKLEK